MTKGCIISTQGQHTITISQGKVSANTTGSTNGTVGSTMTITIKQGEQIGSRTLSSSAAGDSAATTITYSVTQQTMTIMSTDEHHAITHTRRAINNLQLKL